MYVMTTTAPAAPNARQMRPVEMIAGICRPDPAISHLCVQTAKLNTLTVSGLAGRFIHIGQGEDFRPRQRATVVSRSAARLVSLGFALAALAFSAYAGSSSTRTATPWRIQSGVVVDRFFRLLLVTQCAGHYQVGPDHAKDDGNDAR